MLRGPAALAAALGLWACSEEDEKVELQTYVTTIQKFNTYNQRIQDHITNLDDPTYEVTEQRIDEARQLLQDYAEAVSGVFEPDDQFLRSTHELYVRSFADATRLTSDRSGDLKWQADLVANGFKNLRRDIDERFFPSLDVLLARRDIETDEEALGWPYTDK